MQYIPLKSNKNYITFYDPLLKATLINILAWNSYIQIAS